MESNRDKKCSVSLIQMDTTGNREENFRKITQMAEQAIGEGASVLCFPELMNVEAETSQITRYGETLTGETVRLLQNIAREKQVYIHSGSMYEKIENSEKCYNTSLWIDPAGEIKGIYRKMHLFDVALEDGVTCAESRTIEAGKEMAVVSAPRGKIGFATCFDLRFPGLFHEMATAGVRAFFVCASFTKQTGEAHWETLLRARAIENQCYVFATNQCGQKRQYEAYGNSMIIDPWGRVLARAGMQEKIITAEIDWDYVEVVRKQMLLFARQSD